MSYVNGFCLPSSFASYHETVTIDESIPELFERKIVALLKVVFLFSAYYIVDLARGLFLILWSLIFLFWFLEPAWHMEHTRLWGVQCEIWLVGFDFGFSTKTMSTTFLILKLISHKLSFLLFRSVTSLTHWTSVYWKGNFLMCVMV